MRYLPLPTPSPLPASRHLRVLVGSMALDLRWRLWRIHRRSICAPVGTRLVSMHSTILDMSAPADMREWFADDDIFNHERRNLIHIDGPSYKKKMASTPLVLSLVLRRWTAWHGQTLVAVEEDKSTAEDRLEEFVSRAVGERKDNEKTAKKMARLLAARTEEVAELKRKVSSELII